MVITREMYWTLTVEKLLFVDFMLYEDFFSVNPLSTLATCFLCSAVLKTVFSVGLQRLHANHLTTSQLIKRKRNSPTSTVVVS